MKKRKIKWGNVGLLFALIVCIGLVVGDFITLATSTASYTFYGFTTLILALTIMGSIIDYFLEELEEME